jgi:hypothetical protein
MQLPDRDSVTTAQVDVVGAQPLKGTSTTTRMFAGLLSRTPAPPPECETMPNFVANTTRSRRSDRS